MSEAEYEEAFREALLSIPNATIGEPYTLGETRFVVINGEHCVDDVVFNLAWGSRVAARIHRNRNRLIRIHRRKNTIDSDAIHE